jgi:hypothetical protein
MSASGRIGKPGTGARDTGGKSTEPPLVPGGSTDWTPAARYGRVQSERAAAAAQIARSMKVWRKGAGRAAPTQIPEGGGAPLSSELRRRMEPKLGAPLGDVRVHTGAPSSEAASDLGARAFTVGNDVHFNSGEFAPGTKDGDRLIAHELTHVVQGQRSGIQRKAEEGAEEVSEPGEPAEKEADAVADGVAEGLHGKGGEAGEKGAGQAADGEKGEAKPDGEAKAGGAEAKAPAEEKAPEIGAKLQGVGLKVYRAKPKDDSKKRGDHVFANGIKQSVPDLLRAVGGLKDTAAGPILTAAFSGMTASLGIPAFDLTVDKGPGAPGGDAQSVAFGGAKAKLLAALDKFVAALEELHTAPADQVEADKKKVTAATSALTAAWSAFIAAVYDPECEKFVPKAQKGQIAAGQAALSSIESTVAAAITQAQAAVVAAAAKPSDKDKGKKK